jgi:hypothetical protein
MVAAGSASASLLSQCRRQVPPNYYSPRTLTQPDKDLQDFSLFPEECGFAGKW